MSYFIFMSLESRTDAGKVKSIHACRPHMLCTESISHMALNTYVSSVNSSFLRINESQHYIMLKCCENKEQ